MSQIIAIEQARPGMMILRVTAQNGPVKINKSGLISSQAMIQGLIEMGVQEIEYDPDQTVEICQEEPLSATEQTPTQALLRGQFDTRAQKTDSAISDQFNRSLFLPSVSGLPNWWHRSVKPVLMGILMAVGGVATGYALAILPEVAADILTPPPPVASVNTPNKNVAPSVSAVNDGPPPRKIDVVSTSRPQQQDAGEKSPLVNVGNADSPTSPTTAAESSVAQQPSMPNELPASEEVASNAAGSNDEVSVSPELMARFNKVMSDLEQEEERGEPIINDTVVNIHDDIQRVDQLPARLMTRLPTMDFSAHMYASAPDDRWVRVNGQDKHEGDWISERVQIVNIESQRVILRFEGEVFSMSALTDW